MATYDDPGTIAYANESAAPDSQPGDRIGGHRQVYIDTSGRIWMAHYRISGGVTSELSMSFSDNQGVTWTRETVDVAASFGTIGNVELNASIGEANNGDMIVVFQCSLSSRGGGDRHHIYRRTGNDATPAWTYKVSVYGGHTSWSSYGSPCTGIFNHPDDDDTWILLGVGRVATNRADASYWISSNNLTSFGAKVPLYVPSSTIADQIADRGGGVTFRSQTGDKVGFLYHATESSQGRLYLSTIDAWDTTPVVVNTLVQQAASPTYSYPWMTMGWTAADSIRMICGSGFGGTNLLRVEISNVWNATPTLDSVVDTTVNQGSGNDHLLTGYYDENNDHDVRTGVDNLGASYRHEQIADTTRDLNDTFSIATANEGECYLVGQNQATDYGYNGTSRYGPIEGIAVIQRGSFSGWTGLTYIESSDLVWGAPSTNVTGEANLTAGATLAAEPTPEDVLTSYSGAQDKLFRISGQFSSTLKSSLEVDDLATGITSDGDTGIWCSGSSDDTFYKHEDAWTSTILDSYATSIDNPAALDYDGYDTAWYGNTYNKLYEQEGTFSSTLKNSLGLSPFWNSVVGMSWDDENTLVQTNDGATNRKLILFSGRFTTTVKASMSLAGVADSYGVGWTGSDTLVTDDAATERLYRLSGQFTSTVKDSLVVTSFAPTARKIESMRWQRLLQLKFGAANLTAGATLFANGQANFAGFISAGASMFAAGTATISDVLDLPATATLYANAVSTSSGSAALLARVNLLAAGVINVVDAGADLNASATISATYAAIVQGAAALNVTAAIDEEAEVFEDIDDQFENPGDVIDPTDPTSFKLTVGGVDVVIGGAGQCIEPIEFFNSYNNGKTLTFKEIPSSGYGVPMYEPEDDVILRMELGSGFKPYFRGKIKQVTYVGNTNAEEIQYTAFGYPMLANEVQVENADGLGITLTPITTVVTHVGSLAITYKRPLDIEEAVTLLFSTMETKLMSWGIPATFVVTETYSAFLPPRVTLNGGFWNALQQICSFEPGLKPWFDDDSQKWKFVSLFDTKTAQIYINSFCVQDHSLQQSTVGRYTAIELIENPTPRSRQTSDLKLTKIESLARAWDNSLESTWTAARGGREFYDDGTKNDYYDVYRKFYVPTDVASVAAGYPVQVWHKVFDANGNESDKTSVDAKLYDWPNQHTPDGAPTGSESLVLRDSFGLIVTAAPIVFDGNVDIPGEAVGALFNGIQGEITASYYKPVNALGASRRTYRWPSWPNGYKGTAYEFYGVQRTRYEEVSIGAATKENAKAMLRIYKNVIVTGEIPMTGDPIKNLINLRRKIRFRHNVNTTPIQSFKPLVMAYRYTFGALGRNSIQVSTDITGLVKFQR